MNGEEGFIQPTSVQTVDNKQDALLIFDAGGNLVFANEAAGSLFGHHVAEGSSFAAPMTDESIKQFFVPLLRDKLASFEMCITGSRWNGEAMKVVTFRDVTERNATKTKLEHLNQVLRAISNVNQLIVQEDDPERLISQACRLLIETRGYNGAWIAVGDGHKPPDFLAQAGWGEEFEPFADSLQQGMWPHCLHEAMASIDGLITREPTACEDCLLSGPYGRNLAVVAALRRGDQMLGLLGVSFPRGVKISDQERSLLVEVAGDITFALQKIRSEQQRQQAEDEKSALLAANRAVLDSRDFEAAVHTIVDIARKQTGATAGFVTLRQKEDEDRLLFLDAGDVPCEVDPSLPMPIQGLRAEAYHRNLTVFENAFPSSQHSRFLPPGHSELRNVMFVPLSVDGEVKGIIGLADKDGDFTQEDALRAHELGEIAASSLDREHFIEKLIVGENLLIDIGRMAKVGGWEVDIETKQVYWTSVTRELHEAPDGYMPCIDEAIEFFHPEDRPHLEAAINAAIKQAEPYDLELRFVTAKGRNLWTHTQCTPVVKDNRVVKLVGTFQDITRRKKAEYELQGRKAFLNTLLEAIPIPVFYKDRNGKYIGFNRAFELFFGITREQMIGKTVFDISPLELARTYHEKDSELFEKGGLQQYESQIKNTQGVVHDVIFNKAVFTDDRGNITGLIGTILDITARNRALEALLESDRILNATGKMGKIGGWEHNLETGKAVWTQALYDIIEIPYDQPPPGVDEHIAYYPVRDGKILEQAYSQAIENGTPFDLELQVYTSKKRLIWCRAQGQPVYKNGKCVAMRGIFKDITKRKLAENALRESQEKFHSMVENIGIGVSLISPEMEILELNRQMRAWFPDIDLKEHPTCFQGFNIPPGSKVCDYCPTIKTLRDGKVHESTTSTPLGDDIRNYRIVSSPILDAQGEVVAAIEMVEDITERMTLETQLHQAQKLETIGTLAGGIAHDFNNILYAILGNTEIAMGKISKDSEAMPRLQEVLIAGMRARDLVTQILSFSRQSLIDREPIRCFPLIKETLKLIHATLPSSIEIISTLKCECDTVLSSAIEIHQIVMNLCTNAAHAMKEGRGRIEIRLENQEVIGGEGTLSSPMTPGNYVVLTVSDTGCGIPKNLQGRIFDPFFTSKAPGTGTGLGLSVVYGIVKALGGSVEIKSEPDQGSVFKVFIPCIDAQPLPEQETKEVLPQGHGTLLVVDDEKVLAEMQALILKNLGYEVVTRISGREALETFAKDPYKFDLILSDQTMPEMTGDKLAEAILRIRPGIPVILCTGFSAQISEERIKKLGIKKLLIKPISRKILAESISEILVKNGFEGKK